MRRINIYLSEDLQDEVKRQSKERTGRENLSGQIPDLIEKERQNNPTP